MPQLFSQLPLVLLAALVLGCGKQNQKPSSVSPPLASSDVVSANATVRFVALEGGCWTLETPSGVYQPLGLPSQFQVDGMPVHAVFRKAPDAVSVCMLGPIVTLDSIRAR